MRLEPLKMMGLALTQDLSHEPHRASTYPVAMDELKQDQTLKAETKLRQCKYLNNMIEQDHRNIKRIVKPMMGFQSFNTARRTLRGIEAMTMLRKKQVKDINQGDSVSQARFINELFGINSPDSFKTLTVECGFQAPQ
jgi:IS6 family transposase